MFMNRNTLVSSPKLFMTKIIIFTIKSLYFPINGHLRSIKCITKRMRKTFLPAAIKLCNDK